MKLNKKDLETLQAAFATARNSHRQRAIDSTCEDFKDATYEIVSEINALQDKIEAFNN